MLVSLLVGFVLGALALAAAEGLALWCFIRKLGNKKVTPTQGADAGVVGVLGRDLSSEHWITLSYQKQGTLWVLEQDKLPKSCGSDSQVKGNKEKAKTLIVEVSPLKKTARLDGHTLTLVDTSGSQSVIPLLNCTIVAVSGSKLPSRKWYKKYPIKIGSNETIIYNGRNTCYLFAETSWEKESWCKALRLAACADGSTKSMWHSDVRKYFHEYLASLDLLPQKPEPLYEESMESMEKNIKLDEQPSKFRHLFNKFVKKASKYSQDYKVNSDSSLTRDKRGSDKMYNSEDNLSTNASTRTSTGKSLIHDVVKPTSPEKGFSESHHALADAARDDHSGLNEGCLFLNLLFSRMFFDIRKSSEVKSLIEARLQRTFSNMRIPSFIGGITCTDLDLGSLPPYIHDMRTLSVDMNEMWAAELDIEYRGGFSLNVETRLNIREPELQKEIVNSGLDSNSSGEVASDVLEGLEFYGQDLRFLNNLPNGDNIQDAGGKQEGLAESKSTSWAKSRWRTILNCVADQVPQVPLSMTIKVKSLRGTLRLCIKAPPSDQLWFGFTSTPDIDFILDSFIWEQNIKSSHVGLFLTNRFKVAIRDSVVLPNCESICIPWMVAEKDDWVPRSDAPFLWVRQESSDSLNPLTNSQAGMLKNKSGNSTKSEGHSSALNVEDRDENPLQAQQSSVSRSVSSSTSEMSSNRIVSTNNLSRDILLDERRASILVSEDAQERHTTSSMTGSTDSSSHSSLVTYGQNSIQSEEASGKKTSRRVRMMDLRNKMTEKFEVKRRHIEEKGRHMVEKMRENVRAASEGSNSQRI